MTTQKLSAYAIKTTIDSADLIPIIDSVTGLNKNVTKATLGLSLAGSLTGWNGLGYTPSSVTCNGNRSYSLVFSSVDLTALISPAQRLRTTRTTAAPTQCTSLNGTSQYYNKASPAGMTFTDDFTIGGWVKVSSYALGAIGGRYNGTSGLEFHMNADGTVALQGYNASASNYSEVKSYQSIPLNKWIYITGQLDMSAFTATTTTSYIMFDGLDVPAVVSRGGTNPTALVQAGDLTWGASNATRFFPGKIAQAWFAPAKVTQANVRTIMAQGITAALITSLGLGSAYSFNNAITDLNTTNANNLTANGSAVATNADSPFGCQASGLISSTLDYGIIQSVTFSTNTTVVVQVPEGCTIPTSGGVSAVDYSGVKSPYGMPVQRGKWCVEWFAYNINNSQAGLAAGSWLNVNNSSIMTVPVGEWLLSYQGAFRLDSTGATVLEHGIGIGISSSTVLPDSTTQHYNGASATTVLNHFAKQINVSVTSATIYYLNQKPMTINGTATLYNATANNGNIFRAENAYL